jgi:hypothetical protein
MIGLLQMPKGREDEAPDSGPRGGAPEAASKEDKLRAMQAAADAHEEERWHR